MPQDILGLAKAKMAKSLEHFQEQLNGIRTNKANPGLVEGLMVDYYGTSTRLKDLAGVNAPEPRLLIIQPWDLSAVNSIAASISKSDLGLSPKVDGKFIRVVVPELSEDRRKELKKLVHQYAEDNKIAIRNVRRELNDEAKKHHKEGKLTEDDCFHIEEQIQKVTDSSIKKVDELVVTKEKELQTI